MDWRLTRRAQFDLEEIGDYIAEDNPARAIAFVDEILEHCAKLTNFPEAAPLRPEYGDGIRLSVFRRYFILYIVRSDIIEIRRVVRSARARPRIL